MKLTNYLVIFTFIFTLIGCSRQFKIAKVVPGKTSTLEAIRHLDEPDMFNKSSFNQSEEVLIWKDVVIQTKDELVTSVHRKPASHESSLQFWRQHYRDQTQVFSKVDSRHVQSDHIWQLDFPRKGVNVIYDETQDKVIKVVHYYVE
jgi:hypothetical protein